MEAECGNEGVYIYECPCGDIFSVTPTQLESGVRILECPSCSLKVEIIGDVNLSR